MTIRRAALALIVMLVVAVRAGKAAACQCAEQVPSLTDLDPALSADPTLYLFIPAGTEALIAPTITAKQDGRELAVEIEEVFRVDTQSVRRLRLHGVEPGDLEISYLREGSHTLHGTDAPGAAPWPRLRTLQFSGTGVLCGESMAFHLQLDGDRAAAYRLRWTSQGKPHEAYLPTSPATLEEEDPERAADALPVAGAHKVRLGAPGCGTPWLDPALSPFEDAELTMLGVDGEEIVVARGTMRLERGGGSLLRFERPPTPAEPPPVVAPPPPPAAKAAVTWWRVGAGAGGGVTLGALAMWLIGLRRRR